MSAAAIFNRVAKRTKAEFGHPIGLHMFRHCAATTIAVEDPEQVLIAKDLLGHSSFSTTERYYIMAQQNSAAERYQNAMLALHKEVSNDARQRKSRRQ